MRLQRYLLTSLVLVASSLLLLAAKTPPPDGGDKPAPAEQTEQPGAKPKDIPKDKPTEKAKPQKAKPAPAAQPGAEELALQTAAAAYFDPALQRELQSAWDPKSRQPSFTASDNV